MDDEQQQRFKRAVERKAAASEQASHATGQRPPADAGDIRGDQESLRDSSQPQDTFSAREKSTQHKKMTADKWNQ